MQKFDSIGKMLKFGNSCPVCKKDLQKYFASGKYGDIVEFGHKTALIDFKLTKKELTLTRSFELESVPISAVYKVDLKDDSMKVKITPSIDQLIKKFPIAESFMELNDNKFQYAQETGIINIYRIINRLTDHFYFIQACDGHYKRISIMDVEVNDDKAERISDIECWDEFIYVPINNSPNELYAVHEHCSPASRNKRVVFIQTVKAEQTDNIDTKRGGIWLREPDDNKFMDFPTDDLKKLSRKLGMLSSLRG